MKYRIYPPIGIARLGNSPEFFIGPEKPGSPGLEINVDDIEIPVQEYKTGDTGDPATSYRMKRQAARFRIYEFDDAGGEGKPADLPAGTWVQWSVQLVNKKDAVERADSPPAAAPGPDAFKVVTERKGRVIDSGTQTFPDSGAPSKSLKGTYLGHDVVLGELRVDAKGNLLVLGAEGNSRTFEDAPIGNEVGGGGFYNNTNWHDDVADGPVTAVIKFPDGTELTAAPAWVVTAPPDFAPAVQAVVTLYDRILDAAAAKPPGLVELPVVPSFTNDILPMIQRARSLRWVHDDVTWTAISANFKALSDASAAAATRRRNAVKGVRRVESAFTHPDYTFKLPSWQQDYLDKFETGNFVPDFGTATPPDPASPAALTRAVLDSTVGEGFFPGIEAGIILTKTELYTTPFEFRLDHTKVEAGDLTALMALPWQADFLKCDLGWWPTQRPNKIPHALPRPEWDRGIAGHRDLVQRVMMLGVITRRPDQGDQEVQEESRRHPSLPA